MFSQVSLKLPIISPLKTVIFGDLMPSIDIAKRSAAMKVCIELHKINELSDRLVPNSINSITQNTDYLFPHWVVEDTTNASLIGTYKQKRHHELQVGLNIHLLLPLCFENMYCKAFIMRILLTVSISFT